MKILHDWDRTSRSGSWTFWRGLSLGLYGISRKFKFLDKIGYVRRNREKVEAEKLAFMETLIKLDKIAGIISVFGIRDEIMSRYGPEIEELREKYKVDIRRHIHIGEDLTDPNRVRLWVPPLNQSKQTWSFDVKYMRGERVELDSGELPIFHVDRPHLIWNYIDFLYEELIE